MKISALIDKKQVVFDTSKVHDISIPLEFNGDQPNTYGVESASSEAYQTGDFVGDTRKGGGCNFEQLKLTPHCNGTHTECIGHITNKRFRIHEQLKESLIPATLITVHPVNANSSEDSYKPELEKQDFLITKELLEGELTNAAPDFRKALVIRTQPNNDSKKSRNYIENNPPFFSLEAMRYIVSLGVEHILVDLPSVDRLFDDGKLNAHHIFWNIKEESHEATVNSEFQKTITEMIYVEDAIKDGNYLLNLQIAPFQSDASPSRPLLYPIIHKN
ncbi:cyclase family protein [Lutimonas sp.]|uniref:cyclase family protein n=1 Tax=Lutimonas sp. TaxID=1872403 RepID=UPI003D9BEE63